MEDFERELKEDFLEESLQLLEDCEQAFLALEDQKDDAELLDQIFRLAHNLKGTSRAVGFGDVAEFTHEMENLILKLKTGEIEVTDYVVTVLLECNDYLTLMITSLRDNMDSSFGNEELVNKIIGVISGDYEANTEEVVEAANDEWEEEEVSTEDISDEEENIDLNNVEFKEDAVSDIEETVSEEDFDKELASILGDEKLVQDDTPKVVAESSETEVPEKAAVIESSGEEPDINPAAIEALKELGLCDENLIQELESASTKNEGVLNFKKGEEELPVAATAKKENVSEVSKIEPTKPVVAKEKDPAAIPVAKKEESKKGSTPKKTEDESIRVSLSRVEKLNNFVGELVILQTVLEQRRNVAIQDDLSNKSISQLAKLSKEIQEISMSLRMIPIKSTLQKMSRIVRDTSKSLNKKVKLTLVGDETEIDKTVLEHLADPLVHIVRNAVDHGLESTEERIAAGKSEQGHVQIKAFHEGNNLVIQIVDDGNGIKPEVIRNKAIEKGILSPDSKISDDEIVQYIFHPGFSTKEEVTEVSGRGVGMDVVKTNIEKLSGSVVVKTEVGVGSTFKVVLPLTLAIIDGMVVRIGDEKYIIPLAQVHESIKPTQEMLNVITGVGEVLNLRGEVIPLFNVGDTLKRNTDKKESFEKIAIIVHTDKYNFAVIVDDILHQQQVVIKKLGAEIRNSKGFMGSSILGDGKPSFILDLNELYSAKASKAKKINKPVRANKAA
jgi:two-component system chemotaxis sensor kinase CheA